MIRVLIADGQAEVRRGLHMRLAIEPDLSVVGQTGQAGEALALAQTLQPDVIVVDIGMRGADGAQIVRCLRAAAPAAAVVVLTLLGDEEARLEAQAAGAGAFLEKVGGAADLLKAIRILGRRPTGCLDGESSIHPHPGSAGADAGRHVPVDVQAGLDVSKAQS